MSDDGWHGIELTPTFDIKQLRESIELNAAIRNPYRKTCNCCPLGDVYNGFASGNLLFVCPKHCACHD